MTLLLAEIEWLRQIWPHIVAGGILLVTLAASAHAVLYKRDTRATIGWVGLIWLAQPIVGVALYVLLGINRIRRKAHILRSFPPGGRTRFKRVDPGELVRRALPPEAAHLTHLESLGRGITQRQLLDGNRVTPLVDGDATFPAMLAAINEAQRTIGLSSYIFNRDRIGLQFVEALGAAVKRGVEVRVVIDAIGARYSFPSIVGPLRKHGVRVERFLRTFVPGWFAYTNLRSHRKLLIVDGRVGFTGGMNIREDACISLKTKHPLHDLHFRFTGPVVAHLQEVFADDWLFCSGETLGGETWFPPLASDGPVFARGISDGPDEDKGKLRLTLLGALACAQQRVAIVTPYFLPDEALVWALNVTAMRGVQVDIFLPEENNLRFVKWASTAMMWQVLERGCRVWMVPPPFDHTKLMVVDDAWVLVGSGNWDPRSLRLNFEFNVECYDAELAAAAGKMVQQRLEKSKPLTLADVDGRKWPVRLRDGIVRLFSPYL